MPASVASRTRNGRLPNCWLILSSSADTGYRVYPERNIVVRFCNARGIPGRWSPASPRGFPLASDLGLSELVLAHRKPLQQQWLDRVVEFLEVQPSDVGTSIGEPGTSGIDIAMIQTLARRDDLALSRYGHIVVDECHHVPAVSMERILRDAPARKSPA